MRLGFTNAKLSLNRTCWDDEFLMHVHQEFAHVRFLVAMHLVF